MCVRLNGVVDVFCYECGRRQRRSTGRLALLRLFQPIGPQLTSDMPNDIILRVVSVSLRWKDLAEHEHRYMGSGSRSDVVDRREWVWSA
jgi:hypothetical protein